MNHWYNFVEDWLVAFSGDDVPAEAQLIEQDADGYRIA